MRDSDYRAFTGTTDRFPGFGNRVFKAKWSDIRVAIIHSMEDSNNNHRGITGFSYNLG